MNELPTDYENEVGILMADASQSIKSLERSTLERTEFVQVLSHDLQSPLKTNIKLVDILEKEADNEHIRKIKESLQKNLGQLQSYLSNLKQQKLVIEEEIPVEQTDLNILLEQIVAGQQEKANLKFISIVLNNQINNIKIPQKALRRALNNIIDNAIKFSTEDTKIKIDSELNDERLTVKVTDEGICFDQEQGQSIFSFDQRIKNSNEESNGVGRYLVQKQLNRVGGEIKAENEGIGEGATFLINLEVA